MPRTATPPHARLLAAALLAVLCASLLAPAVALAKDGAKDEQPAVTQSPNDPSSAGLVEEPKKYDGTRVRFTGEAISEALERGDMAWLHLNDDAYYLRNTEEGAALGGYNSGMPVWIATSLAQRVAFFGDYRNEGDVVTVEGVFNAACPEHGGDMDIHAETLQVETPGHRVVDPIHTNKAVAAMVLVVLGIALWWLDRGLTEGTPGNSHWHLRSRRQR